ncbi:YciI family protein [Schaalia vaccimaxillae]|uniref:YciI family protein n=1 Tax=Schaalia vaccimaxillae TaxID=183916 RepID=UPI0003B723C6|nr:YciI family protein [Schaalia vaccimaxillae]
MAYFAIEYVYDTTKGPQMDEVRPEHRAFLGSLCEEGKIVASGPLVDQGRALILFNADSPEDALTALDADPFYTNGFILDRIARQWDPVIRSF